MFTFGTLPDCRPVEAICLSNGVITAVIITYGATLQSLMTPDRDGVVDDIVLGHDTLETYLKRPNYLGATVGRYANRIAGGQFDLNGVTYRLSQNDGGNSLHGGIDGFDKRLWTIDSVNADDIAARVRLSLISPDGDQGYPGELRLSVTYTVTADDKLLIDYEAQCDRPTLCNPTNHALFNLGGARQLRSALDAELTLFADAFTPVDDQLIPTGERRPVAQTAFDFMTPHRLSDRVRQGNDAQIRIGRGYDHNYVLRGGRTTEPRLAARLYDPLSGRGLAILTTEPGLQLYTGNFLDGTLIGKNNQIYRQGDGVALEAQAFPDAVNHPEFTSPRLDPGEIYRQSTHHFLYAI